MLCDEAGVVVDVLKRSFEDAVAGEDGVRRFEERRAVQPKRVSWL